MDNLIDQLGTQLQDSIGAHSLYALAAVLAVYVFIVVGRTNSGP